MLTYRAFGAFIGILLRSARLFSQPFHALVKGRCGGKSKDEGVRGCGGSMEREE